MRKYSKFTVVLSLLLVALVLGGCAPKAGIEGKWKGDATTMLGALPGAGSLPEGDPIMEFKDGKINVTLGGKPLAEVINEAMTAAGVPAGIVSVAEPKEGYLTYVTDGDKVTLKVDLGGAQREATGTYKVEGDKLTITVDGEPLELTRVK